MDTVIDKNYQSSRHTIPYSLKEYNPENVRLPNSWQASSYQKRPLRLQHAVVRNRFLMEAIKDSVVSSSLMST